MDVSELVGKVLASVEYKDGTELVFTSVTGERWRMHHYQECCEDVSIEDVCGDLADLVGVPILKAEESTSDENPDGGEMERRDFSQTWTFYNFATIKGYVTVRWYGTSNGCYSERVCFERL
jgi:hypothetical protein